MTPAFKKLFSYWNMGATGGSPWGEAVRARLSYEDFHRMARDCGANGTSVHVGDLVSLTDDDSTKAAAIDAWLHAAETTDLPTTTVPTTLFSAAAFRTGSITSPIDDAFAFAIKHWLETLDFMHRAGAHYNVVWLGGDGFDYRNLFRDSDAIDRFLQATAVACAHIKSHDYDMRIVLEAKPNEPRVHIVFPTTDTYLALIQVFEARYPDYRDMVGVNPELGHEAMAGLSPAAAIERAHALGRLWHIDLNDGLPGKFDIDLAPGTLNLLDFFQVVEVLDRVDYRGPCNFDTHPPREDNDHHAHGRFCVRMLDTMHERVRQYRDDESVRAFLAEREETNRRSPAHATIQRLASASESTDLVQIAREFDALTPAAQAAASFDTKSTLLHMRAIGAVMGCDLLAD